MRRVKALGTPGVRASPSGVMGQDNEVGRDVPGALYGSRLITLPHVKPLVDACQDFVTGAAPVLVEVGFDHGRRLHATARDNPSWHVLGLEVRARRVEEAAERARRDALTNLMVWRMDARTVFAGVLPERSIDIVEVLFPTPWWHPGLRKKRLLFDERFVADVARAVKPGGLVHRATDVDAYAATIDALLEAHPSFEALSLEEGRARRPACAQQSRREWSCTRDAIPWTERFWRRR